MLSVVIVCVFIYLVQSLSYLLKNTLLTSHNLLLLINLSLIKARVKRRSSHAPNLIPLDSTLERLWSDVESNVAPVSLLILSVGNLNILKRILRPKQIKIIYVFSSAHERIDV